MKLFQLHESYETLSLLRKAAKQLGYSEPNIYQYTDPEDVDHHDNWNDVQVAVQIAKQDIEDKADSFNAIEQVLHQRGLAPEDLNPLIASMDSLKKTPFGQLKWLHDVSAGLRDVSSNYDHLRTSAGNVQKILMLINSFKHHAKSTAEPGSEEGFKRAIAAAVLRKIGVTGAA